MLDVCHGAVRHEAETARLARSFILQNGAILYLSVLDEVLAELLITEVMREAPDEYLSILGVRQRLGLLLLLVTTPVTHFIL